MFDFGSLRVLQPERVLEQFNFSFIKEKDSSNVKLSQDGSLLWTWGKNSIHVFSTTKCLRISSWTFSQPDTEITAVTHVTSDKHNLLLIATCSPTSSGLVSLFDLHTSLIIRTVDVDHEVTALEAFILPNGGCTLLGQLVSAFDGVGVIGCSSGRVILFERWFRGDVLVYPGVDDDGLEVHDDTQVSCLHFLQHSGQLVVGFAFGAFQIWCLDELQLEFSCPFDAATSPVTHFASQEPENDPRVCSYLWVGRGPLHAISSNRSNEDYGSGITMYQLCYSRRETHATLGVLHLDMSAVAPQFEHLLGPDPISSVDGASASLRELRTLRRHSQVREDSNVERLGSDDVSLLLVVWTSDEKLFAAIFDLNRWYQAQMPPEIRLVPGHQQCLFLAFYEMENVTAQAAHASSISRFHCIQESHLFPSSLSFNLTLASPCSLVRTYCAGLQRSVLAHIQRAGAAVLQNPGDVHNICVCAGLCPPLVDTVALQRPALLTVAFQQSLRSFLMEVIRACETGELSASGVNLSWFVDWTWDTVSQVKSTIDRTSEPLFDWSCTQLDEQNLQKLERCRRDLNNMHFIFGVLIQLDQPSTLQGEEDLVSKQEVVRLLGLHLDLLLWSTQRGLLPEASAERLSTCYERRRAEVTQLHLGVEAADVLFIDCCVARTEGRVGDLWQREGGALVYPPSSVHAALCVTLLSDVTDEAKLLIMLYFLIDCKLMLADERQHEFESNLGQLCHIFKLNTQYVCAVRAHWLLDRQRFREALDLLSSASVRCLMAPWQHELVIRALLYQNECEFALRYLRMVRDWSSSDLLHLRLSVLLANKLTSEALHLLRSAGGSMKYLLAQLVAGCRQTGTLDLLLKLPLAPAEDEQLVDVLQDDDRDLLVGHLLQRGRLLEAVEVDDKMNQEVAEDEKSQKRLALRKEIINWSKKLLCSAQSLQRPQIHARSSASHEPPRPLSTRVVARCHGEPVTQATLLLRLMEGVDEVRDGMEKNALEVSELHQRESRRSVLLQTQSTRRPAQPSQADRRVSTAASASSGSAWSLFGSVKKLKPKCTVERELVLLDHDNYESPNKRRRISLTRSIAVSPAWDMLNTSEVKRKRSWRTTQSAASTPQSILKGRSGSIKHFPSEAGDFALPSPPIMSMTPNKPRSAASTPKILRFVVPDGADEEADKDQTPDDVREPEKRNDANNEKDDASLVVDDEASTDEEIHVVKDAYAKDTRGHDLELPVRAGGDGHRISPSGSSDYTQCASPRKPLRSVRSRSPTPERRSSRSPKLGSRGFFEGWPRDSQSSHDVVSSKSYAEAESELKFFETDEQEISLRMDDTVRDVTGQWNADYIRRFVANATHFSPAIRGVQLPEKEDSLDGNLAAYIPEREVDSEPPLNDDELKDVSMEAEVTSCQSSTFPKEIPFSNMASGVDKINSSVLGERDSSTDADKQAVHDLPLISRVDSEEIPSQDLLPTAPVPYQPQDVAEDSDQLPPTTGAQHTDKHTSELKAQDAESHPSSDTPQTESQDDVMFEKQSGLTAPQHLMMSDDALADQSERSDNVIKADSHLRDDNGDVEDGNLASLKQVDKKVDSENSEPLKQLDDVEADIKFTDDTYLVQETATMSNLPSDEVQDGDNLPSLGDTTTEQYHQSLKQEVTSINATYMIDRPIVSSSTDQDGSGRPIDSVEVSEEPDGIVSDVIMNLEQESNFTGQTEAVVDVSETVMELAGEIPEVQVSHEQLLPVAVGGDLEHSNCSESSCPSSCPSVTSILTRFNSFSSQVIEPLPDSDPDSRSSLTADVTLVSNEVTMEASNKTLEQSDVISSTCDTAEDDNESTNLALTLSYDESSKDDHDDEQRDGNHHVLKVSTDSVEGHGSSFQQNDTSSVSLMQSTRSRILSPVEEEEIEPRPASEVPSEPSVASEASVGAAGSISLEATVTSSSAVTQPPVTPVKNDQSSTFREAEQAATRSGTRRRTAKPIRSSRRHTVAVDVIPEHIFAAEETPLSPRRSQRIRAVEAKAAASDDVAPKPATPLKTPRKAETPRKPGRPPRKTATPSKSPAPSPTSSVSTEYGAGNATPSTAKRRGRPPRSARRHTVALSGHTATASSDSQFGSHSRETSPTSSMTSEKRYPFSPPTAIGRAPSETSSMASMADFAFSGPLTRSRRREATERLHTPQPSPSLPASLSDAKSYDATGEWVKNLASETPPTPLMPQTTSTETQERPATGRRGRGRGVRPASVKKVRKLVQ